MLVYDNFRVADTPPATGGTTVCGFVGELSKDLLLHKAFDVLVKLDMKTDIYALNNSVDEAWMGAVYPDDGKGRGVHDLWQAVAQQAGWSRNGKKAGNQR